MFTYKKNNEKEYNFHVSIDLCSLQFNITVDGQPYETILDEPPPKALIGMYRTRVTNEMGARGARIITFRIADGDTLEVVPICINHNYKTSVTKLSCDKEETTTKRKKLKDPSLFPMTLGVARRGWKVQVLYNIKMDRFIIKINNKDYYDLPYLFVGR